MVWGQKGRRRRAEEGEESLREWDSQHGGRTESKSKERDILMEGPIMGLARKLALEKFLGIHRDDLS